MNRVELSIAIKKDSETYVDEFLKQFTYLISLLMLNTRNSGETELKDVFIFVMRNIIRYDKDEIMCKIEEIEQVKRYKLYKEVPENKFTFSTVMCDVVDLLGFKDKNAVLNESLLLSRYNLITRVELFEICLSNGFNCEKLEEFVDESIKDVLIKYYLNTKDDKIKRISFFYVLKYIAKYSNEIGFHCILLDAFKDKGNVKLNKYAIYFFNNQLDIDFDVKKIFNDNDEFKNNFVSNLHAQILENSFDLDIYTQLLDIFVKVTSNTSLEIIKQMINMVEINKLMKYLHILIKRCKTNKYKLKVMGFIHNDMLNFREDGVTAQGINLLREMYKREENRKIQEKICELVWIFYKSKSKTIEYAFKSFVKVKKDKFSQEFNEESSENHEDSEIQLSETESFDSEVYKLRTTPTKEEKEAKRLSGREKIKQTKFNKKEKRGGQKGNKKRSAKNKLFRYRKK